MGGARGSPPLLDLSALHRCLRAAAAGACACRTRRRCRERRCPRCRIRARRRRRRPVSDSEWPPTPLSLRRALRSRLPSGQPRPFPLAPGRRPSPSREGDRGALPPCSKPRPCPWRGSRLLSAGRGAPRRVGAARYAVWERPRGRPSGGSACAGGCAGSRPGEARAERRRVNLIDFKLSLTRSRGAVPH